jgi:hypothetical protein
MKQIIEKYFTIIVLVLLVLTFFKGCNDSRRLTKIETEITALRDSMVTKDNLFKVETNMTNTLNEFQGTLWGFGDSYTTLLNITGESKIENKSNEKAFKIIKDMNQNDK